MPDKKNIQKKPNLSKSLFWDCKFDAIDWDKHYASVIDRVLERGAEEEKAEMIRYYGREKIIHALKYDIPDLYQYAIDELLPVYGLNTKNYAPPSALPGRGQDGADNSLC